MLKPQIDINKITRPEERDLLLAAAAGNREGIKAALADGADLFIKDEVGNTAAHFAAFNHHPDALNDLLAFETKLNNPLRLVQRSQFFQRINNSKHTIADAITVGKPDGNNATALTNFEAVGTIIKQYQKQAADTLAAQPYIVRELNQADDELIAAARDGQMKLIAALRKKGADMWYVDRRSNFSAAIAAAKSQRWQAFKYFLDQESQALGRKENKPGPMFFIRTREGNATLMDFILEGHQQLRANQNPDKPENPDIAFLAKLINDFAHIVPRNRTKTQEEQIAEVKKQQKEKQKNLLISLSTPLLITMGVLLGGGIIFTVGYIFLANTAITITSAPFLSALPWLGGTGAAILLLFNTDRIVRGVKAIKNFLRPENLARQSRRGLSWVFGRARQGLGRVVKRKSAADILRENQEKRERQEINEQIDSHTKTLIQRFGIRHPVHGRDLSYEKIITYLYENKLTAHYLHLKMQYAEASRANDDARRNQLTQQMETSEMQAAKRLLDGPQQNIVYIAAMNQAFLQIAEAYVTKGDSYQEAATESGLVTMLHNIPAAKPDECFRPFENLERVEAIYDAALALMGAELIRTGGQSAAINDPSLKGRFRFDDRVYKTDNGLAALSETMMRFVSPEVLAKLLLDHRNFNALEHPEGRIKNIVIHACLSFNSLSQVLDANQIENFAKAFHASGEGESMTTRLRAELEQHQTSIHLLVADMCGTTASLGGKLGKQMPKMVKEFKSRSLKDSGEAASEFTTADIVQLSSNPSLIQQAADDERRNQELANARQTVQTQEQPAKPVRTAVKTAGRVTAATGAFLSRAVREMND
ncbi:MAG: hypothetical protein AB7G80_06405 [Dongiaceae bacterium]